MKFLKKQLKLVFWMTVALLLFFSVMPRGYAQSNGLEGGPQKMKFVITGYYTPLPNQAYYATGSFESDIRLNGEGVHAADGTLVYPGLAAAPPNFKFGTKMEIPGFGIVAVHDRGGAIKNNRLDIWLGSGEEGLRRALGWGMRTLEVTVFGINPDIQESVHFENVPLAENVGFLSRPTYFVVNLAYGDEGETVRELQRFLKKLGYFNAELDGFFGEETRAALFAFQLNEKIIDSDKDSGAGNFGPRSRATLESVITGIKTDKLRLIPQISLRPGDQSDAVRALQEALKELGFLQAVNGVYNEATSDAVLRFQLDYGVVDSAVDLGAGFYGKKTQDALSRIIAESYTPRMLFARSKTPQSSGAFEQNLQMNDSGPAVALLQEELKRLNFFALAPTGYFGKTTEHAVLKFQQTFDIAESAVGPITRVKLREIADGRKKQQLLVKQTMEEKRAIALRIEQEKVLLASVIDANALNLPLTYGTRGKDVETLQVALKRLGFFPGRLTTRYFGNITKTALISFQKSHGLEASGEFDPTTKKVFNKIISGV